MTSQNFGWIPFENRTDEQNATHDAIVAQMPVFDIVGSYKASEHAKLYEARQKASGKSDPPYIWQQTGSCVGAGGGNCLLTLMDVEILAGEMEEAKMVWWLFTYGESREIAGMRGQGQGSFGSAYAKAITQRGIFAADASPDLPQFEMKNGWYVVSKNTEFQWSDGGAIPQKWNEIAKENLVKTMAPIKSAEDAAKALQNGYPLTCASNFGTRGARVQGDPPVMLAEWNDNWPHQMFVDAWWDHPSLGEIFRIGNNWGPSYHGDDPCGAPAGGFWVKKSTFDEICRSRHAEVYAMSAFDGFPARSLWWDIV